MEPPHREEALQRKARQIFVKLAELALDGFYGNVTIVAQSGPVKANLDRYIEHNCARRTFEFIG